MATSTSTQGLEPTGKNDGWKVQLYEDWAARIREEQDNGLREDNGKPVFSWFVHIIQTFSGRPFPQVFIDKIPSPLWAPETELEENKDMLADWLKRPRASLLKDGEEALDDAFRTWYFILACCDIESPNMRRYQDGWIEDTREVSKGLNDEQLLRFQQEYYRVTMYSAMHRALWRGKDVLEVLKEEIQPIFEELSAMREDDLGDFVWSEEDREEEREAAVRAEERKLRRAQRIL